MSDILTFESKGDIKNKTIAWIGDGNNVSNSFIEAPQNLILRLILVVLKNIHQIKKLFRTQKIILKYLSLKTHIKPRKTLIV